MNNDNTNLFIGSNPLKVLMGPTNPNPGPIFPRADATALEELTRSTPSNETKTVPNTNIKIYSTKKLAILTTVSLDNISPFVFMGITALG